MQNKLNTTDNLFVIVDIDGTITIPDPKRKKAMKNPNTNWEKYYKTIWNDKINYNIVKLITDIISNTSIIPIFITGRSEVIRGETRELIEECFSFYPSANMSLQMRGFKQNNLSNAAAKKAIVNSLGLTPNNVVAVFDDEDEVVEMYKSLGFTVLQC